ncbi:F0F1 ATP synthase subunit gamma [Candidatus Babeliales bacterium]|nr:F0F1 ATP synthase subunit gamma [Candidatus Babeliales bacterium]
MSQLIQLRRKIKSIKTTQKITYAMRLISMSLYSRHEKTNVPLTHYSEQLARTFLSLSHHSPGWNNELLFPKDTLDSTPLIIIVTSSKGLCGGFNSNLLKYFKQNVFFEEHQTPTFITIGLRAFNFAKQQKLHPILNHYNDFNSRNFNAITDAIVKLISNKENFSSITFYSNFFKSFFVQRPKKTLITPVKKDLVELSDYEMDDEPILEQNQIEIMDFLAIRFLRSKILQILFQSILSEQAARFLAMDNATTNANKFLEKLTLQYNKARQSLITKELSELSASFGKFS